MRSKNIVASVLSAILISTSLIVLGASNSASAANPNCTATDGDYIVTFNRNANVKAEIKEAPGKSISPKFSYELVLNGFAANLSAEQVCAFSRRPNIENIEPDGQVSTEALTLTSTTATSWGLDRVDTVTRNYDSKYIYSSNGTGIAVYVVDTGINSGHEDFSGRIKPGYSSFSGSQSTEDCNGHGTHVAGTIGGTFYGIAKQVNLVPVRVLDCSGSGSNSGVISGLEFVLADKTETNTAKVVNMSLGGGASTSLDAAVTKLTSAGITVVVAAGNSKIDACKSSPARVPSAITVAASDKNDKLATFSNVGSCVDIIAPGVDITSDWIGSSGATKTISGTSMASPHVAGAVARYISRGVTASDLIADSSLGIVSGNLRGTGNKLLYLNPTK